MVDLLTYTYETLVPKIKGYNPPKKQKVHKLIEESSVEDLFAKEGDLVSIASEIGNRVEDITILFKAKVFLSLIESEKVTVNQASRAIAFLADLKALVPDLDTNAAIEDLLSSLDQTICEAGIEEIFQWADLIKEISPALGRQDAFIPAFSLRLKSLIWSIIPTNTMESNIELATTITRAMPYSYLELNDIIEIVAEHCLDFIETVNNFHEVEENKANVQGGIPGTQKLLGILNLFDIVAKDIKLRRETLVTKYTAEEAKISIPKVTLNKIKSFSDIRLTERILYSHNDVVRGLNTVVREGILNSGFKVAVKIYTANNVNELNYINREIEVLDILSGKKPCFLHYFNRFLQGNSVYIVTELCDRSLAEDMTLRKNANKPYTIDECLSIMSQLLEGYLYMYGKKIYHQDIKPQNIMLIDKLTVKIIDFNVVIKIDDYESTDSKTGTHTIQGTRGFMSPEVLAFHLSNVSSGNLQHTYKIGKSDVFSLGLVFLGLFTFDELTGLNQESRNGELLDKVRRVVSDNCCKELICKMLNVNPKSRLSFTKALAELPGKSTRPS